MKISSIIYKLIIFLYKLFPLKKQLCLLMRKLKISNNKFYKDFKFKGLFRVNIANEKHFKLFHFGGTIENEIFWKGLDNSYEQETIWLWEELCNHSEVIFDVGANTGVYSLVAKTINPNAKVFAFEPSKNIFNKLQLNNNINRFDINCNQTALSNKSGQQIFYDVFHPNRYSASLSADKIKNTTWNRDPINEYYVNTMKCSDFIKTYNIEKIDLFKIDVELHEPEVIAGMENYLELYKPIVIIEILTEDIAIKLNSIIDTKDYEIFCLDGFKKIIPLEIFKAIPSKENYLFFHKDRKEFINQYTSIYKLS